MIILALGSNIGDRKNFLNLAIEKLIKANIVNNNVIKSSIYETPALQSNYIKEHDMPFLNMVIASKYNNEDPLLILQKIKKIEQDLGRINRGHWAPREIDIDIIAIDDIIYASEILTIPHKEMLNRDFVLQPLYEILPNWQHPKLNKINEVSYV